MNLEEWMANLDPKTAARIKTAEENTVKRLPVASYSMTNALGGGLAKGRIFTVYGNQSSGKSTLFQESIGKIWQPQGLVCAYVDTEAAFEKEWAKGLGVDPSEMILITSKSSGKIEKELRPLLKAKIDVVIIDSISDIMPEEFLDEKGNLNEQDDRKKIGAHAKAITQLINGILYENEETAVVLLSQNTTKFEKWGAVQAPHGGNKVQFASSQIVRLVSSNSDSKAIKGETWVGNHVFEEPIGRPVNGIVEKNKLGPQSRAFKYNLFYAGDFIGIDRAGELIDAGLDFGVIEKSGTWLTFGEYKAQGDKKLAQLLRAEPDAVEELERLINVERNI